MATGFARPQPGLLPGEPWVVDAVCCLFAVPVARRMLSSMVWCLCSLAAVEHLNLTCVFLEVDLMNDVIHNDQTYGSVMSNL
jgi:hypothetical protein